GAIRRVDEGPVRWRAELSLEAGSDRVGTRVLESESTRCADFADSLALVVAGALESLETSPPAPLHLEDAASHRWRSGLGTLAVGTSGLVPGFAPGVGIWATIEPHPDWRLELDVNRWWERSALVEGHGATFDAFGLGVATCRRLIPDGVALLWGCLTFN